MSKSTRASNPLKAVIGVSLVIILTSGLASVGVGLLGGISLASERSSTARGVTGAITPARVLIADTLASLGKLGTVGPISWASDKPYPYNCGNSEIEPSAAASVPVTVNGVNATVAVSAYGAGLGASTYPKLISSVSTCTGPLDVVLSAPAGFGVESAQVSVNRGGAVKATTISRTGDIVWFVSSPDVAVTASAAGAVARTVDILAPKVCTNRNSVAADATRNLVVGSAYKAFSRTSNTTIDDPGLPFVDTANVKPVPLDTPIIGIEPATPDGTPNWPVWPKMPDPIPVPTITVPVVAPVLTGSYMEQLADEIGPGCGWAFTDSSAPSVSKKSITDQNESARAAISDNLTAGASSWGNAVVKFWNSWPEYQNSVLDYQTYQSAVKTTNVAWDAINTQWVTYNADLAKYNVYLSSYNTTVARIAKTASDYAAALAACKATPAPSPSPSPSPSSSSSSSPDSTSAPSDCDSSVPKPKAEAVPVAPVAPTPPTDPRPLSEQVAAKTSAAVSSKG
jgi:hypothetical protein